MIDTVAAIEAAPRRADNERALAEIGGDDVQRVIIGQQLEWQGAFRPDDDVIRVALNVAKEFAIAFEHGFTTAVILLRLRDAGIHEHDGFFAHRGWLGDTLRTPGPAKADQYYGHEDG